VRSLTRYNNRVFGKRGEKWNEPGHNRRNSRKQSTLNVRELLPRPCALPPRALRFSQFIPTRGRLLRAPRYAPLTQFHPFAPPLQLRTISDQWPVFLFVDFKVTCCLFSYVGVYTRRQHTATWIGRRTSTRSRARARASGYVCSRASASVYRNARGQSNPPTCVEDATCMRGTVYVASDR